MSFSLVQAARTVRHATVLARADMATFYTWKTWLFGWMVRLLCQVTFFSLIGVLVSDPEFTVYITLGACVMICVTETMMATASTSWDKPMGTLPLLGASPVVPGFFFFGRSLQWPASATVTTTVALLALPPFFGVTWPLWQIPVLVVTVALIAFSSYCMTLALAVVALAFPEARNVLSSVTTLYITAFCGALVPLSYWPEPIRAVAQALPATHGLESVRLLESGAVFNQFAASLGTMVLSGVVWLVFSFLGFHYLFARARAGSRVLDF